MRKYSVQQGWVRYRQFGSHVEEHLSDSPSSDEFDSYEDAKAAFDAIDLRTDWRTEKMCAGKRWRYDYRDAYKSLEVYEMNDDGYADNVESLEFEKYGEEEEACHTSC